MLEELVESRPVIITAVTSARILLRIRAELRLSGLAAWRGLVRLVNGNDLTHAAAIAERLGDLELRILTTSVVGGLHYQRAEFEQAVELANGNLAALPADWVYKVFGFAAAVTADRKSVV